MSGAVVCVVSDKSGAFTGTLAFCVRFPPGLWRPPERGGLGRAAARPASVALVQEPRAWPCLCPHLALAERATCRRLWTVVRPAQGRWRHSLPTGRTGANKGGFARTRPELAPRPPEGNGPDTPKRSASPPLLTAAASTGHLQSAGAFPTYSLRWSHVTEKETKAQRIPRSHRRDPDSNPGLDPGPAPEAKLLPACCWARLGVDA